MSRILKIQKDKLSPQQQKVLKFVTEFIAEHRYGPTEQEVAEFLNTTRTNAQYHLLTLEFKKRISRKPKGGFRNIKIVSRAK